MAANQHDIIYGIAVATAIGIAGWYFVRLPRRRFGAASLVVIGIVYAILAYALFRKDSDLVGGCFVLSAPVAFMLAIFGICFRKVTPKAILIIAQVGCWFLVAVPTIVAAFVLYLVYRKGGLPD